MAGRLAGKRAIVTGAGQGIGRASVERFVAEGALVTALDMNSATLADLQASCGCAAQAFDLTEAAALAEFASSAGDVDILFLCAGHVATGTILDCDDDDWRRSFDLNVTAMMRMIRAILPSMLERHQGSIITMSSVASSVRGVPDRFAYSTTKAAVIGLTKAIAADFVGQGIRCNAICPGSVETPSLDQRMRDTTNYEATRAAYVARQPMGRFGNAREIADLAVYLASDESRFTTGQCHIIDGGWSM